MSKNILVVAPHPDDESIGLGGTLLKHHENGDNLYWLIMSHTKDHPNFSDDFRKTREIQIDNVKKAYAFKDTFELPFLAAKLDTYPLGDIIEKVNDIIQSVKPSTVYLPFSEDIHSDHEITYKAVMACTKSFRSPCIEETLMYETLSETDYAPSHKNAFSPNVFVDITHQFDTKLSILKLYDTELAGHPFPRSIEAIKALATTRGAQAYMEKAEAFMLIKQRR